MKSCILKQSVSLCQAGTSAQAFTPGDFILVSDNTLYSNLIKFGQGLRKKGSFTKWTHAALIVSPQGDIVEADGNVKLANLDKYLNKDYYIVRITASDEDRHEAVNFALNCVNEAYGWTTIVSIFCSLLTGLHFSFGFDGQEICSGLVARSLERTSAIFPRDASHITPSDLAQYYLTEGTINE